MSTEYILKVEVYAKNKICVDAAIAQVVLQATSASSSMPQWDLCC